MSEVPELPKRVPGDELIPQSSSWRWDWWFTPTEEWPDNISMQPRVLDGETTIPEEF